jgi:hypothetical protein
MFLFDCGWAQHLVCLTVCIEYHIRNINIWGHLPPESTSSELHLEGMRLKHGLTHVDAKELLAIPFIKESVNTAYTQRKIEAFM